MFNARLMTLPLWYFSGFKVFKIEKFSVSNFPSSKTDEWIQEWFLNYNDNSLVPVLRGVKEIIKAIIKIRVEIKHTKIKKTRHARYHQTSDLPLEMRSDSLWSNKTKVTIKSCLKEMRYGYTYIYKYVYI